MQTDNVKTFDVTELIDALDNVTFKEGVKILVSCFENGEATTEISEREKQAENIVFYDVKDIAKMFGCSIPTARELMHRPDFPLIRFGKILRVSKTALDAWAMQKRI